MTGESLTSPKPPEKTKQVVFPLQKKQIQKLISGESFSPSNPIQSNPIQTKNILTGEWVISPIQKQKTQNQEERATSSPIQQNKHFLTLFPSFLRSFLRYIHPPALSQKYRTVGEMPKSAFWFFSAWPWQKVCTWRGGQLCLPFPPKNIPRARAISSLSSPLLSKRKRKQNVSRATRHDQALRTSLTIKANKKY